MARVELERCVSALNNYAGLVYDAMRVASEPVAAGDKA